jgi:hypothetical protein
VPEKKTDSRLLFHPLTRIAACGQKLAEANFGIMPFHWHVLWCSAGAHNIVRVWNKKNLILFLRFLCLRAEIILFSINAFKNALSGN